MTGVLALETATDACSVAIFLDGHIRERHALAPRQHSQMVFTMLGELLPLGNLGKQGIDVIAYGAGPGSFTGLRIAASTAQGLAFSSNLPAIPVSTLAVLARGRCDLVSSAPTRPCCVRSMRESMRSTVLYMPIRTVSPCCSRAHGRALPPICRRRGPSRCARWGMAACFWISFRFRCAPVLARVRLIYCPRPGT